MNFQGWKKRFQVLSVLNFLTVLAAIAYGQFYAAASATSAKCSGIGA